jgi:hypothetical protein
VIKDVSMVQIWDQIIKLKNNNRENKMFRLFWPGRYMKKSCFLHLNITGQLLKENTGSGLSPLDVGSERESKEIVTENDISSREGTLYIYIYIVSSVWGSIKHCEKQTDGVRAPRFDVGKERVTN